MFPVSGAAAPNIAGAERVAAEDLVQQAELELAVAGAAEVLVEEDRPEALVLDLVLQPFDQRLDLRVLRADRVGEDVVERLDLLTAELLDPVELLLELRIGREVPSHGVRRTNSTTPWSIGVLDAWQVEGAPRADAGPLRQGDNLDCHQVFPGDVESEPSRSSRP